MGPCTQTLVPKIGGSGMQSAFLFEKLTKKGIQIIDWESTFIDYNVEIGLKTKILPNTHLEGISKIGKNCTLAGCTALVDNIQIADEVHITAKSLITKSIKESGIYSSGTPFMKNSDWKKNAVGFKKLHKLSKL